MKGATRDDRSLEGAIVEVSPSGWRLSVAAANPSRTARRWLDRRFGPDGGFCGGLAELGSTGPVASGDSWTADPPAIAGTLAKGGLPIPLPSRKWKFAMGELVSSPAGAKAKVVFDETFPVAGESRSGERTIRVGEGSRVRAHGEVSGVPGAWHRTGRMVMASETDMDSTSEGVSVRVHIAAEEREAWEAGGTAPVMPAAGAVAIGHAEPWAPGDTMLETGKEQQAVVAIPVDEDGKEGVPEKSERTVAWTAEVECVEAYEDRWPKSLVVVLRDWTTTRDGESDRSLAGAVLRVGPDGFRVGSGGDDASAFAKEWAKAHYGQGARRDDALRAAATPSMPVRANQSWGTDPEETTAALQARFSFPIPPERVHGTGKLLDARGAGDAVNASTAYEVEAAIACAPGCGGEGAEVMKGTIRVKGTAGGPAARWTRLGSFRDTANVSVTLPGQGLGEQLRRVSIVEERRIERNALVPEGRSARSWAESAAGKNDRRDYDGAAADASRAIAVEPTYGDAWFQRARARVGKKDAAGAIADYTKVVEVDPGSSAAFNNRGGQKKALGDLEGAIADYSRAIELSPKFALAFRNRGVARAAKGDHAGAIEDYDRAIAIKPKYVEAYNDRGLARYNLREYAAAAADYSKAAELAPKEALYITNRGNAKSAAGDLAGSLADHDAAIALDSSRARAYYFRADVRDRRGDVKGALEDYGKAIELEPDFPSSWNDRGLTRQDQGDFDGAIADFTKSLELAPRDRRPLYNRARARYLKGDVKGAIQDCTKVLEIDPRDAAAYQRRGEYRLDDGDLDAAVADWEKALEADPRCAPAHRSLALARFRPGLPAGPVVEGLRKAIEFDEDSDYERLWLWLALAGTAEEQAATKDLVVYAAARKPDGADDWYPVLVGLLSGTKTEEAALAAAGTPDSKKGRERLCEAAYYAGMIRAIRGDVPGAVERFDRCLATGVRRFTEYIEAGHWRAALLLGGSLRSEGKGLVRIVVRPDPRGPLALAGVQDGDRISGMDGSPLQPGELDGLLLKAAPGTKLRLDFDRAGNAMQREVTLGSWKSK
jgi:tetratricopeptide (TPR) repeat protein